MDIPIDEKVFRKLYNKENVLLTEIKENRR